ncbi:adipocyte plasma membrane-associated protein-like isoform X2 [Gordionus sp. m RMFG-2023]|uniref:adipocyte plasma membrane-associated protein-like isoform X2 n=1 Tax=Gordionus sp. m RMFG-2023 TaxID=3053472 RepID=UPI0031FCD4DD
MWIIILIKHSGVKTKKYDEVRPALTGALQHNDILTRVERKAYNELVGPESFAHYNNEIYTSTKKGIFKLKESRIEFVARIGKPPCDSLDDEDTCGRPLGIEFNSHGLLYIVDSYLGIYTVNVTSTIKKIDTILDKAYLNSRNIKFLNSLQLDEKNDIYFTSSSTKWNRKDFMKAILEARPDGKVYKYNPKTKELNVAVDGLIFPNGLLISPNHDYLLISESVKARILKFNLRGPNKGKLEVFASNLPLIPDNIKYNSKGNIWVAAASIRAQGFFSPLDSLAPYPQLKRYLFKLIDPSWISMLLPKYGLIVELDGKTGKIIRSFHDPKGRYVFAISEAHEFNNKLYLGSYVTPFYSVLNLDKL